MSLSSTAPTVTRPLDANAEATLRSVARIHGVSDRYWDWHGTEREVSSHTLIAVLRALGVSVPTDPEVGDLEVIMRQCDDDVWRRVLPQCSIVRQGQWRELHVHVPDGAPVRVSIEFEDGGSSELTQIDNWDPPREIDGERRGRAGFALDGHYPLGYHTLVADVGTVGQQLSDMMRNGDAVVTVRAHLIVVPDRLRIPVFDDEAPEARAQRWGVVSQLYSVRSAQCWGMGDLRVLADMNERFARHGADFHLINPLHACAPVFPIEASPYLPVTRQFLAPIYIAPDEIPELRELAPSAQLFVRECHELSLREQTDQAGLIDRDQVWSAKREALRTIFRHGLAGERAREFADFIASRGEALRRFALWSALVEHHGMPLRGVWADASSSEVRDFECVHADDVRFHMWLQWVADTQLGEAQRRARDAGMDIGVMADLAVGVHPFGADTWANPELFARDMSVGAPPDMYSQQGQDWSQPPWNPATLAATGYRALRDVVRACLSHCGAVRIDHILGMFRLWWIPRGCGANEGAYVSYDHEAMVGVLLLEAQRHGAVVIGEDLGTVEPWVRSYLAQRGVLGTSILWFEREGDGTPLHADHYRRDVLTAVNTHDLPPTLGYLRGVQVDIRAELGLLVDSRDDVEAALDGEITGMKHRLVEYGIASREELDDDSQMVRALYQYAARTPSRLLGVSLVDVTGEARPQNFPGTHREYPNWQVPLGDSDGREVTVEELDDAMIARFAHLMPQH